MILKGDINIYHIDIKNKGNIMINYVIKHFMAQKSRHITNLTNRDSKRNIQCEYSCLKNF